MIINYTKKLFKVYYLCLDYFILLLAPLTLRIQNSNVASWILRAINRLYFFWPMTFKNMYTSHESLEKFQGGYDQMEVNFYDRFVGKDWYKNKTILDVGCFVGAKAKYYADHGAKNVVGVDLSQRGIQAAQKLERENLTYLCVSTHDSNFQTKFKNYFDEVVSFTVFEHIDKNQLGTVLEDCYSVLKDGGHMMIVYNFYYDRHGSHANHFIYHAWPQLLFNKNLYRDFCDSQLAAFHLKGQMGYFPKGFSYSHKNSSDCYMNLNELNQESFEEIIKNSSFGTFTRFDYSRTKLVRFLHQCFKFRWATPSSLYILEK